jgi:WD40 repeat protein/tetratricopeptide (TPR) repeat protein
MAPFELASREPEAITYPYPGLRAFGTEEAEIFFGREKHIDDLLERLQQRRFLAVVGPSGCGKSSLIRAGLIPALHAGLAARAGSCWQVAVIRPGSQPMKNLARALPGSEGPADLSTAKDGFLYTTLCRGPLGLVEALAENKFPERTNLLLVVDQFEELFRVTHEDEGAEARAFVELLLASIRTERFPIYVIITMRSDFLGNCPIFRGLPEALNDSQYLTPRLDRDEQRAAIVQPAKMFDVTVRPEVVNRILNEMGSDPDQLPLMQHLLMRMWHEERERVGENRQHVELTLETYRRVGGLQGCVQSHADRVFGTLTPDEQALAELLFRQLTEATSDLRLVRRPRSYAQICKLLAPVAESPERGALRRVLDTFRSQGLSFLMPPPGETIGEDSLIDISHESIIRQWDLLKGWAKDEYRIRRVRLMMEDKTARWKEHKGDKDQKGYLLYGVEFAEAKEWRKKYPDQLDEDEDALLTASIKREQEEVDRLTFRNRVLLGLVGVVCVLGGLVTWAWVRATEANLRVQLEHKENVERQRRSVSTYVANGVRQMDDGHMEQALIWFAEAFALDARISAEDPDLARREDFPRRKEIHERRLALVREQCPKIAKMLWHERGIYSAEFSSDGNLVIAATEDGKATIWDMKSGTVQKTLVHSDEANPKLVRHAAFNQKASRAVTAGGDVAVVWEVESGKRLRTLQHCDLVRRAVFSPDGNLVATASKDRTAILWNADTGKPVWTLPHDGFVYFVAFSPDGRRLVTACADERATVRVWDVATGKPKTDPLPNNEDDGSERFVVFASFDPKGDRIVTAGSKGDVLIRDVATGKVLRRIQSQADRVERARFTMDGANVITLTASGSHLAPLLWNASTGSRLESRATAYSQDDPNFSQEGRYRSYWHPMDYAVQIRDEVSAQPHSQNLGMLKSASFQHDGKRLLTVNGNRAVGVWDLIDGKAQPSSLKDCREAKLVWLDPNGQQLLAIHDNLSALAAASALASIGSSPPGPLSAAAELANGRARKPVRIWNVAKNALTNELLPATATRFVAFSPNGDRLVVVGQDGALQVTNPLGGVCDTLSGHEDLVFHAAFSTDGSRIVTSSRDFTARLWDAATKKPLLDQPLVHNGWVRFGAFSHDGLKVVTASSDRTARIWDVVSGGQLQELRHPSPLLEACFSHKGDLVVTVCEDKIVRLWNAESGQASVKPLEHKDVVLHALFSPNDRCLLTVTPQYARVWDTTTGEPVTPQLNQPGLLDAAFAPLDDFGVISVAKDGTLRWWDSHRDERRTPDDFLRLARLISGSQLDTDNEGLVPRPPDLLNEDWEKVRPKISPASTEEVREWHQREASDAEKTGDWEVAAQHLTWLHDHGPQDGSISQRRGHARAKQGNWQLAIDDYNEALADRHADEGDVRFQRGRAYVRLNEPEKALLEYDAALRSSPSDGSIYLAQSLAYWKQGNRSQAQDAYRSAVAASVLTFGPVDYWWSYRPRPKPEAEPMLGHWQEVLADYSAEINPVDDKRQDSAEGSRFNTERTDDSSGANQWIYYRGRGLAQASVGNWKEAADDFRTAAGLKSSDVSVWQGAMRTMVEAGLWSEAEQACDRLIKMDKKDWASSYFKGISRKLRGQYLESINHYREAIQRGGSGWGILAERARAHYMEKHYRDAIADYSDVLREHRDPDAFNNLGVAYESLRNHDKAILNYTEAISLKADQPVYFRNRGNAYHNANAFAEAAADYAKCLEFGALAPDYIMLGRCHVMLHEYSRAIEDYSSAIRLNANDATYYNYRGVAYQRNGDRKKALADFRAAHSINPAYDVATINFARLTAALDQIQPASAIMEEAIETKEKQTQTVATRQELANLYENHAMLLQLAGKLPEAETACRTGLERRQTLAGPAGLGLTARSVVECIALAPVAPPSSAGAISVIASRAPNDNSAQDNLALCQDRLAYIFFEAQGLEEAETHYREEFQIRERLAKDSPTSALYQNNFAWFLTTCPMPKFRDPARAVSLAAKAVELEPRSANYRNTLGVAYYFAGNWNRAIEELNQSEHMSASRAMDWLFLAMAHKRQGDPDAAKQWYTRAVQAIEKEDPETTETKRFRAEAAALLRGEAVQAEKK